MAPFLFGGGLLAFIGEYCIYDGISSEKFGLRIVNENSTMENTNGEEIAIQKSAMMNGLKYAYMGTEPRDPCTISFMLMREDPMDAAEIGAVMRWLAGRPGYKELRFVQPDISTVKFNCIFTEVSAIQHGNATYGVSVVGECDSCFGEGNPIVATANSNKTGTIRIMNYGDYMDYVYPVVKITMPSSGGDITISNTTDNNRVFSFTGLSGSEVLTVDCLRKTIVSSAGMNRLGVFSKNWLPLLPGVNSLAYSFSTAAGEIEIQCPLYRRIGV